jgi:hypothetical protein
MMLVPNLAATAAQSQQDSTIDDLDRAIVNLAARINSESHDLLVLIRRFDERAGWLRWGFQSCADWLHWRCDLSLSASREKVRVAHALKTLPSIAMSFARGELSYSKVRALTRVADYGNEDALLTFALHTTAARVEERCRELRCGTEASIDDAVQAHVRRALSVRRDPSRGTVTFTVELLVETAQLVEKALDRAMDGAASPDPEFAEESWAAQRADALVAMAKEYLNGNGGASTGTSDNYQVVVHVDHATLTQGKGRSGLPIESVRRIACDSDRVVLVEDEEGEPLSIGRKSRMVSAAIKRALWARDKGCRFPGCGRTRFVDAHHIVHWSAGGETSLANLMLLCGQHHRLVHEGGFRIEKDYRDRWFFKRPDGRAVPFCGYRAEDMTDDDVDIVTGEYLRLDTSAEGFSNSHPSAEGFVHRRASAGEFLVRRPSAEVFAAGVKDPPRLYVV